MNKRRKERFLEDHNYVQNTNFFEIQRAARVPVDNVGANVTLDGSETSGILFHEGRRVV